MPKNGWENSDSVVIGEYYMLSQTMKLWGLFSYLGMATHVSCLFSATKK